MLPTSHIFGLLQLSQYQYWTAYIFKSTVYPYGDFFDALLTNTLMPSSLYLQYRLQCGYKLP